MSITYDHKINYNINKHIVLYCNLIINSAYGAGIHNCIYKILTFLELSVILQKKHAQYAEINT